QLALATDLHASDTFVPALNDLAGAQHEVNRMAIPTGAVDVLAVVGLAGVIDFDMLADLSDGARAHSDVPVLETTGGLGGRTSHLRGTAYGGLLRRCLVGWSLLADDRAG